MYSVQYYIDGMMMCVFRFSTLRKALDFRDVMFDLCPDNHYWSIPVGR